MGIQKSLTKIRHGFAPFYLRECCTCTLIFPGDRGGSFFSATSRDPRRTNRKSLDPADPGAASTNGRRATRQSSPRARTRRAPAALRGSPHSTRGRAARVLRREEIQAAGPCHLSLRSALPSNCFTRVTCLLVR
ncbi:hypothetical protein ANCDUO_03088 [Ancylostoma duodenale]|uniref:Uncharacterized protein n=1 Tax=Ancylostoma duodenale TaxID=51022 RepID=A0A0C2H4U3_9BILA|nr:hypothetical protein ANCDUO_03088 [Ancylostoma duodenale]